MEVEFSHDSSDIDKRCDLEIQFMVVHIFVKAPEPFFEIHQHKRVIDESALSERAECCFSSKRRPFVKRHFPSVDRVGKKSGDENHTISEVRNKVSRIDLGSYPAIRFVAFQI